MMIVVRIILNILVSWIALGIITTVILSQTPYADNPWWLTIALWPVFLWALAS